MGGVIDSGDIVPTNVKPEFENLSFNLSWRYNSIYIYIFSDDLSFVTTKTMFPYGDY